MESVPGLVVTQHSGEGKANQYFLRGFNLDHGTDVRIVVNGMLVNKRSHRHGQGWADTNFIIPEFVCKEFGEVSLSCRWQYNKVIESLVGCSISGVMVITYLVSENGYTHRIFP